MSAKQRQWREKHDMTMRQALRDAVTYQEKFKPKDWRSQCGMYYWLANDLAIDIGLFRRHDK